jgi:hypothetical protein
MKLQKEDLISNKGYIAGYENCLKEMSHKIDEMIQAHDLTNKIGLTSAINGIIETMYDMKLELNSMYKALDIQIDDFNKGGIKHVKLGL